MMVQMNMELQYRLWLLFVDTVFFVRDNDRSGLIGEGKVTVYFDSR